ncbi:helix-turn-helix domain-containing protein [Thermomonospora amylolytica]|uniref:helix-turn-helix domain-containing protein n=1 Tax=Thermomonospora amylolytica TaxID=1411117 RepID=UPI000E6CA55F|nr:helix-turn-helix domain-containing protein [Thermomonospora amylolytica]
MSRSAYREGPAPEGFGFACVWTHARAAGDAPFTQLVVPDGCVDVVWSDWDGQVIVAGPDTGPRPAVVPAGGRMAGVRFRPGLAAPVLGVPVDAVRDGRVPLAELWGGAADALAERLGSAPDPVEVLVRAVGERVHASGVPADPLAPALVEALAGCSVRDAAARLGVSERQLRRRAIAAFGYGPKTVQRVLRFQRALRLVRAGVPAAEAAFAAGYADQAHLAHEVRALAGVTLGELVG